MTDKPTKPMECHSRDAQTNQRCGAVVGATDGENLFIEGKLVPFNPTMMAWNCPKCRNIVRWDKRNGKKPLINNGK